MRSFVDNAGRSWTITINVFAVKRVRGLVGVDLYTLIEDSLNPLGKLLGDVVTFVDVLYVLCKDEADARGISDEDFGRSLSGDVLDQAMNAFLQELTDFFPDARVRTGIQKILIASRKVQAVLLDRIEEATNRINAESIADELTTSFSRSPESLG